MFSWLLVFWCLISFFFFFDQCHQWFINLNIFQRNNVWLCWFYYIFAVFPINFYSYPLCFLCVYFAILFYNFMMWMLSLLISRLFYLLLCTLIRMNFPLITVLAISCNFNAYYFPSYSVKIYSNIRNHLFFNHLFFKRIFRSIILTIQIHVIDY